MTPRPIYVERDGEGLRLALLELFEEEFGRARIERLMANANEATQQRLIDALPKRTLSPGYYAWCFHLLRLESEKEAGLQLDPAVLSAFEGAGMRTLVGARADFRAKHPPCSRCGVEQETRFAPECCACGVKFARKGSR